MHSIIDALKCTEDTLSCLRQWSSYIVFPTSSLENRVNRLTCPSSWNAIMTSHAHLFFFFFYTVMHGYAWQVGLSFLVGFRIIRHCGTRTSSRIFYNMEYQIDLHHQFDWQSISIRVHHLLTLCHKIRRSVRWLNHNRPFEFIAWLEMSPSFVWIC